MKYYNQFPRLNMILVHIEHQNWYKCNIWENLVSFSRIFTLFLTSGSLPILCDWTVYFLAEILCLMITYLNNSTLYSEKSVLWTDIDTNVTHNLILLHLYLIFGLFCILFFLKTRQVLTIRVVLINNYFLSGPIWYKCNHSTQNYMWSSVLMKSK